MMMCLGMFLFGSNFLELSRLPGLPGSLFTLPNWGSFPSVFVEISFQFLAVVLLPLAPLWFGYWNVSHCPRDSSASLHFFGFLFLHSVPVGCLFLPFVPIIAMNPGCLPVTLGFLYIFLYFTFDSLHFSPLIFDHTQPILWASWLPVFWTLQLIGWLSPHHLVLFWSFDMFFHLGHISLS